MTGATGPLLLALDTSTGVGSVAVARGGTILAREMVLNQRKQAARLIPAVEAALEDAGVGREELEGIVVGRGPGSFTGVRIAAATARGLAMALGCPLWAWSSLAGAAASHGARLPRSLRLEAEVQPVILPQGADCWPRYALFDARADRVYGACYRFLPHGMEELLPPRALTVDELLREVLPPNTLLCGSGALAHVDLLEDAGHTVLPYPAGLPTAEGLLRVHALQGEVPPLDPGSRWEPDYLRASSAEREAGAREGAGGPGPG
jgi:tRNA threonylcarbamoyladenosine biosynthesis protein TsaB